MWRMVVRYIPQRMVRIVLRSVEVAGVRCPPYWVEWLPSPTYTAPQQHIPMRCVHT